MSDTLATLVKTTSHQVEIKKSRFLAMAAPATNVEAAMAFVEEVSVPEATHNCWAYRIGQEYRFHDDGEPSGSAGKPILTAIDGQTLDQVVVVVTRWFGGTKLGIGGLMRAYGGTATECLRSGPQETLVATTALELTCGYTELALLQARLAEMQAEVQSLDYGAFGVSMRLSLPDDYIDQLETLLADASRGTGTLKSL